MNKVVSKTIVINYDSFTYNLVQYLGELSVEHEITKELIVRRNDEITLEEIINLNPSGILLSPGPGNPDQSGINSRLIWITRTWR